MRTIVAGKVSESSDHSAARNIAKKRIAGQPGGAFQPVAKRRQGVLYGVTHHDGRFLILHKELDADDGELTRTLKVRRGFIAERYKPLVDKLLGADPYLLMADFADYVACQERVDALYLQSDAWSRRAVLNIAGMGRFSADRAIREYATRVWGVTAVGD